MINPERLFKIKRLSLRIAEEEALPSPNQTKLDDMNDKLERLIEGKPEIDFGVEYGGDIPDKRVTKILMSIARAEMAKENPNKAYVTAIKRYIRENTDEIVNG